MDITDADVEAAMHKLADTDLEAAKAKAKAKAMEQYGKTVRALQFLEATGTVAEREARALASEHYRAYLKQYEEAVMNSERLANERATAAGVREVWRSLQANRRQGS